MIKDVMDYGHDYHWMRFDEFIPNYRFIDFKETRTEGCYWEGDLLCSIKGKESILVLHCGYIHARETAERNL
jgi:hypothetical protein